MSTHYYEARGSGPYFGRVYHYDASGNNVIVDWTSPTPYLTEAAALDAASDWAEQNNIDAEMA